MERIKILHLLTMSLAFLSIVPRMECQIRPPVIPPITQRPLCASQFALVNYACAFLPPTTTFPPPSPPPAYRSLDDEHGGNGNGKGHDHNSKHEHKHGHGHRHRHHHHHHHHHPSERLDNCCRWAKQLDNQCVCEVLVRLPGFLSRPAHDYTIAISESCSVTYTCSGHP